MATKKHEGIRQYQSEMSQACVVIHNILGESYDINLAGLLRYSPKKNVKKALYAIGFPHHDTYLPNDKAAQLDEAVQRLLENYEKLKLETGGKRRKPRKF